MQSENPANNGQPGPAENSHAGQLGVSGQSKFRSSAQIPAVTPKMSFRSLVANGALFSARPPATPIARHSRGDAGVQRPTADDDASDLHELPATHVVLPERFIRPTSGTARRYQPQTSSTVEAAGPIKLEFGRPDIAAYLQRTFAMRTDPSCTEPEHDLETASVQAEVSFQAEGSRRNGGLPGRQRSSRLNPEQTISKVSLLKADANVVEACQQQRNKRVLMSSSTTSGPSCPLPWLVLYCGANPKVEEAIAKTCDKLGVNWQKEYFGAW